MLLAIALAAIQCVNLAQKFYFDNTFPGSQTHRLSLCVEKTDFAWFKATWMSNFPMKEKSSSSRISDFYAFINNELQIAQCSVSKWFDERHLGLEGARRTPRNFLRLAQSSPEWPPKPSRHGWLGTVFRVVQPNDRPPPSLVDPCELLFVTNLAANRAATITKY